MNVLSSFVFSTVAVIIAFSRVSAFSGLTVGISDAEFNRLQPRRVDPGTWHSRRIIAGRRFLDKDVSHIARIRDYHRVILISSFVRAFMTAYQRTPRELDSASTGYKMLSRG